MDVHAEKVVRWIKENLPPISWNSLVMSNINVFFDNNIKPNKIDKETVFNKAIMSVLRSEIKKRYDKDLPNTF